MPVTDAHPQVDILTSLQRRLDEDRFRQVYCNRDLNLSRVHWIGFDMDYTLALYRRDAFDALAHRLTLERLVEQLGYPREVLAIPFDPAFAIRGLVVDHATGYLLKMDSHRHVGAGVFGFERLDGDMLDVYRKAPPNLSHDRYELLDTLFEIPEAYIYAAVIDMLRREGTTLDPERVAHDVRTAMDAIHADGSLKGTITADIATYVDADPELALTLHRFRSAGKRLFLMTNSFSEYTHRIMGFLLDGVHPDYPDWRSYFDIIITGARKPHFFKGGTPFLRLDDDGRVVGEARERLHRGVVYQHGNIADFERAIGLGADEVLYIGDHIYGDILRSKRDSAWRTAMIIPEIEPELRVSHTQRALLREWTELEHELQQLGGDISVESDLLHRLEGELTRADELAPEQRVELEDTLRALQRQADRMRKRRRELVRSSRELEQRVDSAYHPTWGPLFKMGNENSIFGEQVEQYACVYTSRVSNFFYYSPMHYFRAPRAIMPHEIPVRE